MNPTLTLLKDATGLTKTVSVFQSEKQKNYLKSGNRASYSQTKKFQNGSAYEQQSSGNMEVRYAINTSLNFSLRADDEDSENLKFIVIELN